MRHDLARRGTSKARSVMSRVISIAVVIALVSPTIADGQNPQRTGPVLSPGIQPDGNVTFRLRAAEAKEVTLRGQWTKQPLTMTRGEGGVWSVTAEAVPAGVWEYNFQVDGLSVLDSLNPSFKP